MRTNTTLPKITHVFIVKLAITIVAKGLYNLLFFDLVLQKYTNMGGQRDRMCTSILDTFK